MAKSFTGILALFLALFLFADSYPQTETQSMPENNFMVFMKLTQNGLDEINDIVTVLGREKIYKIDVENKSPEKEFFLNALKQKFTAFNFIYETNDSYDYRISFSGLDFSVGYSVPKSDNVIGDEYFTRTVKAGFKYSQPGSDDMVKNVVKSAKDNVRADFYDYIQESEYAFMKSGLPDKGFMNKILVPAIVVAATALTAILFFTIRSK